MTNDLLTLLTAEQVAEVTQLKKRTIYNAARGGDLKAIRVGQLLRFRPESVAEWLRKLEERGGDE
jgi:excisionase family DNA binding protein